MGAWDVVFVLVGTVWFGLAVLGMLGHVALRDLPADAALTAAPTTGAKSGSEDRYEVSIIVPARDEGARIEKTVLGLLDQVGVRVQLLVIDDRSRDSTRQLLERLATEHADLTVVRIEELPAGWLGKCHACHVGAARATGEWLLFTDGDTWCRDDVVARALHTATTGRIDHLCLLPGLGKCTVFGEAVVLLATIGMLGMAFGVNRDFRRSYTGVGAFTLIRRAAYDAIGGHERLRLEVIDDFGMGYLVKKHGLRSRLYAATRDVEVRWAHSARSFVQVVEKNMFAKLGFSLARAGASIAVLTSAFAVPIIGAFTASTAGVFAVLGMASIVIPAMWMARRYGWFPLAAFLAPLSIPILIWATIHSTRLVMRQGGIRWRETFYSLAELRSHSARIDS